jgi:phosphoribosyl-ATP pyrophosphohydrolase|tara:strand:- start:30 stop:365 length:336 start_codon:yes stop_codon:yes gene_type:complete
MDNVNNKEFILAKLDAMLTSRKESLPENSYVASLYKKGNEYINGKVLEETNELIEAVNEKDKNHIIHEAADLWFHSLVSLSFNGISSKDILAELNARFGLSGLEEKKLRNK